MTTEPRSSRTQKLRRLLLLPTGQRRKGRRRHAAPKAQAVVAYPPRPNTPPRLPVPPVLEPFTSAQALDAVMRRLSERTLAQAAGHEGSRVPVAAPAVAALALIAPQEPLPPARPIPRPRPPVEDRGAVAVVVPVAQRPAVKITTLGSTPPSGTAVVIDPTDLPTMPILTPDEFLMTRGWDALFDVVKHDEVDTLSFTLRQGGAAARVSDTTIEIPKIPAQPEQVPHLCKHCHELHAGLSLGSRMWRCDGCKKVAAY